jgi:hypothetical protein
LTAARTYPYSAIIIMVQDVAWMLGSWPPSCKGRLFVDSKEVLCKATLIKRPIKPPQSVLSGFSFIESPKCCFQE